MKKDGFFAGLSKIKGVGYIMLALAAGIVLLLLRTGDSGGAEAPASFSAADYARQAEETVRSLAQTVCKGSCTAAVSLKSGYRYSYASDQTIKTVYNPDGSVASKEAEVNNRTVNSGGGSALVVTKESPPEIQGVAVVCPSATQAQLDKIRALVSALYGLDESEIYVTN